LSEHEEQVLLFAWSKAYEYRYPELGLLYAIPNGAKLSWRRNPKTGSRYSPEAQRLLAEGLRPGVPDTMLPVPRGIYHGAYCELKVGKNKPTEEQSRWLEALHRQGYATCVAYGAGEAIRFYAEYLGLDIKEFNEWLL